MPDGVVLTVEPPDEDGGMPVIGYRVHCGDDVRHDVTLTASGTRLLVCCVGALMSACSLSACL